MTRPQRKTAALNPRILLISMTLHNISSLHKKTDTPHPPRNVSVANKGLTAISCVSVANKGVSRKSALLKNFIDPPLLFLLCIANAGLTAIYSLCIATKGLSRGC
jgi:hypothetical protein